MGCSSRLSCHSPCARWWCCTAPRFTAACSRFAATVPLATASLSAAVARSSSPSRSAAAAAVSSPMRSWIPSSASTVLARPPPPAASPASISSGSGSRIALGDPLLLDFLPNQPSVFLVPPSATDAGRPPAGPPPPCVASRTAASHSVQSARKKWNFSSSCSIAAACSRRSRAIIRTAASALLPQPCSAAAASLKWLRWLRWYAAPSAVPAALAVPGSAAERRSELRGIAHERRPAGPTRARPAAGAPQMARDSRFARAAAIAAVVLPRTRSAMVGGSHRCAKSASLPPCRRSCSRSARRTRRRVCSVIAISWIATPCATPSTSSSAASVAAARRASASASAKRRRRPAQSKST